MVKGKLQVSCYQSQTKAVSCLGSKLQNSVVRKTILAMCDASHSQSRGPKDKVSQTYSQKSNKDKPRFRKYDNVDQNEVGSDDPEVYNGVSKMTIYYDAVKIHSGTGVFDETGGLEKHECYENNPIISGPESCLLSSREFHTSSNVKSMGDQINGLKRTSLLYNHCISDPERSETDGLNSNDKSMRGFTIDPESREALYFDVVMRCRQLTKAYHDHTRNLL